MHDQEKAAAVALAFELGKITRHAMHHSSGLASELELSRFANHLLEAGDEKIPQDLLLIFVEGFHEAELTPDRRAG